SLQLERLRAVVVANRPLARKSVIRPSDVRILRRAGSRVPHDALTDLGQAVGKEVVREVRAGDVLAARAVKVPIVVRRRSPVLLYLDGPGFRITARGIAMEDGGIGQMIRVINQSSQKVLYGRIEGNGSVRIPF
ncbi:MAG: flagellar basal body P-ring formation chaperone FlgA, partial [Candidatus Methylomirabilia bacterium]